MLAGSRAFLPAIVPLESFSGFFLHLSCSPSPADSLFESHMQGTLSPRVMIETHSSKEISSLIMITYPSHPIDLGLSPQEQGATSDR